jgi:PPM family protein phosphatase
MSLVTRYHATFAARSERGRRSRQDDAVMARTFASGPWLGLFAVADGVSGHLGGGAAARTVIEALSRAADAVERDPRTEPLDLLDRVLAAAAAEIAIARRRRPIERHAGTTLTVLALHDAQAYVRHVGDSRLYRFRGATRDLLTRDHTVAYQLLLEGALSAADYATSPMRRRLTRYFGREEATIERARFALEPLDRFLLVTDGCVESGADPVWHARGGEGYNPARCVRELFGSPGMASHEDNATAIAVAVN